MKLVQPSDCQVQGTGGFFLVAVDLEEAEDNLDLVFLSLCFAPMCMFTPFFEVVSYSQKSHRKFCS